MPEEEIASVELTQKTAKRLLVDWANSQDGWVRSIVSEVLASGTSLDSAALDTLYAQFLSEKGFSENDPVVVPEIELGDESAEVQSILRLVRLEDIKGVNALAPDQKIDFNSRVTVVFGENGAGKTGYTRILKRAASARSAETIIGNVHDSSDTGSPSATLTWTVDDVESSGQWENELGFASLGLMDVFDSPSVLMHLDTDLTYSYVPADLALFKYVNEALKGVAERANGEITARTPKSNVYLQMFDRGSEIYPLIETLSAATDIPKLRGLGALTTEEEAKLPGLTASVTALQGDNIQAQTTMAKARLLANTELSTLGTAVAGFNQDAYAQALSDLTEARKSQATLEATISTEHEIPGADSKPWRDFVAAGDVYREHLQLHEYPTSEDVCLYCRQRLASESVTLLAAYKDIANNAFQTAIDNAVRIAGQLARPIVDCDLDRLIELFNEQGPDNDPHSSDALKLVELLVPLKEELTNTRAADLSGAIGTLPALRAEATNRVTAATKLIGELGGKAEERKALLAQAQTDVRNLQARIRLKANLEDIEAYVENAKWTTGLKTVVSRLPPTQASLTVTSKAASQLLLNDNFDEKFKEESEALRAPLVQLEFPGRDGASRRVKTVISHKPSAILSEGEQKVIAMADFLAESSLRAASSPVIFDDPVNSLDYKRIKEVSARIAKLSGQRQVVVFTHNIWFATELLSQFEDHKDLVSYYSIDDDGPVKGIVTGGTHPRWDTVKKMTGKINAIIQAARSAEGEIREALIEQAYSSIRAWTEVVVEQEVLARVVQRYEPNVMMTRLPAIDGAKLEVIKGVLMPLYEKACRIMEGHSQPLETLSVRPNLTELETEWAEALAARTAYVS